MWIPAHKSPERGIQKTQVSQLEAWFLQNPQEASSVERRILPLIGIEGVLRPETVSLFILHA